MTNENGISTIFIVAGSPAARAGLESLLQADEQLIITGSAGELSNAPLDFSGAQAIDVLLVNVEREKEFDALSEFLNETEGADAPFVVALLSPDFQNYENPAQLLQNGARGILLYDAAADEIVAALKAAAQGLFALAPEIMDALWTVFFAAPDFSPNKRRADELIEHLTARETEVLELLVEGESNKIIAFRLNISEHTVKFHIASIFGKLGVTTRTEAVTQALRRGLILL